MCIRDRRYAVKRATVAACAVLLIVLLAPGTVVPASVSHVSAAPATDSSSVQISFQVDTLIPVQDVTAQINERSLSVESSGYQQYQVTVEENGYLLLDIYSVTGMHTSHGMEITGIDSEAPVIVSHERQDVYKRQAFSPVINYDFFLAYSQLFQTSRPQRLRNPIRIQTIYPILSCVPCCLP